MAIRAGLIECRRLDIPWAVLLGHEAYYPRFGFAPASRWNLAADYGDSDTFRQGNPRGHFRYASEFTKIFGPTD